MSSAKASSPPATRPRHVADPSTESQNASNNPRAVAFGRNYYYACGSANETIYPDADGAPVHAIELDTAGTNIADDDGEHDVASIVTSSQSTVFLTKDGKVYQSGTLHGFLMSSLRPITIPLPLRCVQISAGRHFCLGRMEGGMAVVSWGAGHFGQLGIGHQEGENQITFTPRPVIVERLLPHVIGSPVTSVAAGDWHGLALTSSGRVWAWGSNRSQQCGRKPSSGGNTTQAPTLLIPLPVPLDVPAIQISAGRWHSVALTDKDVYCWGSSSYGQCGNIVRRSGISPPRRVDGLEDVSVRQVVAGGNHTLALTSGGRVMAWGANTEGQLGIGVLTTAQPKPRQVAELDFVAIAAGREWKAKQLRPTAGADVNDFSRVPHIVSVSAGPSYSAAISSSGHLYCWGSNDAGQLGVTQPEFMPMKDNYIHVPAKTSTLRDLHVSTFDSRHNVLLPTRISCIDNLDVKATACGPNHMFCLVEPRTPARAGATVGRTLFEVQEDRRRHSLERAHNILLEKVNSHNDTEELTSDELGSTNGNDLQVVQLSSQSPRTVDAASPQAQVPSVASNFSPAPSDEARSPQHLTVDSPSEAEPISLPPTPSTMDSKVSTSTPHRSSRTPTGSPAERTSDLGTRTPPKEKKGLMRRLSLKFRQRVGRRASTERPGDN